MTFQAYLDNIEAKTGLTPREFIALAHARGLDAPGTKAGAVIEWLAADYDLGRGYAMALVQVIRDSVGEPVWLDGKATNPNAG
jgi:hypothetical protein